MSRTAQSSWLLPALIFSACWYQDQGAAPVAPGAPLEASCSRADDYAQTPLDPSRGGRMRTHLAGPLAADPRRPRRWNGGPIPSFVPRELETLELFVLDDADGGHLALYREPYNLQSCQLGGGQNCAYEVRHYGADGGLRWRHRLNRFLSRPDHLEIQDVRLAGGVLYFNEACQSYASGAGGRCSSLVALDPRAGQVLWRTEPLVSNGRFAIRGCYVIAGYGFTSEPDHVFLVERATGKVVQRLPVSSAPEQISLTGRERVQIELYSGASGRFKLEGPDRPNAQLVPIGSDAGFAGYGGASYGGASYGGATYGHGVGSPRRHPPPPRRHPPPPRRHPPPPPPGP